jgi:hypothetical protein
MTRKTPNFTKAHFEIMANINRYSFRYFKSNKAHLDFVDDMAFQLAFLNPYFNRQKFILASMPTEHEGTRKAQIWYERAGINE